MSLGRLEGFGQVLIGAVDSLSRGKGFHGACPVPGGVGLVVAAPSVMKLPGGMAIAVRITPDQARDLMRENSPPTLRRRTASPRLPRTN